MPAYRLSLVSLFLMITVGCGSPSGRPTTIAPESSGDDTSAEATPEGQLPEDVTPEHYTLALTIDPRQDRFSGSARIRVRLDRSREVIWLHGRDLTVVEATVTPEGAEAIAATYEQVNDQGVAKLTLPQSVPPGLATIAIQYTAPFDRQLKALYRVDQGEDHYAFTQFEAIDARAAFPGFDEPRFKTPFDVTLVADARDTVAGNTPVEEETELEGGHKRLRLATTPPLPTYLLAWAVGPLEVVVANDIAPNEYRDRPLPFRGLAPRGQGERLAHAMTETPRILESLESYFGSAYPFRKLDIVAVPDFAAGAMENVGLVTFRDYFLLFDESSPAWQYRAFASIMSHELAHMWFGNLVTMEWWDDIWLNEAFATWMASKAVRDVYPEHESEVQFLASVQSAMGSDSLVAARQIRQPIETNHDIRNAFDGITYRKGGGVLEMFERYMGVETFRAGIRQYMRDHAFSNATYEQLLAALSTAAGQDIATPFRSFLFQPGLPHLAVSLSCAEGEAPSLSFAQSRYFPVGSTGSRDQTWTLPVCARYQAGEEAQQTCGLISEDASTLELEGEVCPSWVMPNADGAGYYRFSLEPEMLSALTGRGFESLTPRERLALADSMKAAFEAASMTASDYYGTLSTFASDDARRVAMMPTEPLTFARQRLVEEGQRPRVEALVRQLYQPHFRRLGFAPRRGAEESGETAEFRAQVIATLAELGRDARVRRDLARRAQRYLGYRAGNELHPEALDANLRGVGMMVAVQDGDAAFFDAVLEHFVRGEDGRVRGEILGALSHTQDDVLSARVLALALDERLRTNEITRPLSAQLSMEETREAAWSWLKDNYDALVERAPGRAGYLPWLTTVFCSEEEASEVESFFADRIEALPGGPRNLAGALEAIRLCAAQANAHRESARAYFAR